MRRLRTASTRRLLTIVAVLIAAVAGAGIAQAALTTDPKPAPKPLDQAVYDAFAAPAVDGITARVHFTNNLLPSGSLPRDTASPVLTGADGRVWLTGDGKIRLELQSTNGDAQIVADGERFMLYDATSKTAYVGRLPQQDSAKPQGREHPSMDSVQKGLAQLGEAWTLSGAKPTSTAGQPSYTVRIAPKDDGGLIGAAEVAWDAVRGVPLRAAVYAQDSTDPVLELEATEISYGAIPAGTIDATPPAGAKVVEIDPPSGTDPSGKPTHVEGVGPVSKQLDFPLAAPDTLAGLPRRAVRLVKYGNEKGAVVTYGRGLGQIVVFQQQATAGESGLPAGTQLPTVNIDGATGTELATALGTLVTFDHAGVRYYVAGSVPPLAAENAARGLQ
jgi:outer membrane lipoprotein-sorting protein